MGHPKSLDYVIPYGELTIAMENGHLIVDFPIKNGDFPSGYD